MSQRSWLRLAKLGIRSIAFVNLLAGVEQGSAVEGSVQLQSDVTACTRLANVQDVLQCALTNHPEAQRAGLAMRQAETFEATAGQLPNPELGARSVFGNSLGDVVYTNELNLTFPIEIGGRRSSRIEKAAAEKRSAGASLQKSREEVLMQTLASLYRVRQISDELHTVEESLETFGRILHQFGSRLRRTPEQEVSMGVFQVATADYQLRKSTLDSELSDQLRLIELAIGRSFEASPSVLPQKRKSWPEVTRTTDPGSLNGSAILGARAALGLAQADLSTAESLSWPALRFGPSVENQATGPIGFWSYGVNFAIEVPLFQVNSAGRATARAGVQLAEKSVALREMELSSERTQLVRKYENATKALGGALTHEEIAKKHANTDALFARGIIPSSLVIEAHRQMVDFTKDQNELELAALEALWRIRILDGKSVYAE